VPTGVIKRPFHSRAEIEGSHPTACVCAGGGDVRGAPSGPQRSAAPPGCPTGGAPWSASQRRRWHRPPATVPLRPSTSTSSWTPTHPLRIVDCRSFRLRRRRGHPGVVTSWTRGGISPSLRSLAPRSLGPPRPRRIFVEIDCAKSLGVVTAGGGPAFPPVLALSWIGCALAHQFGSVGRNHVILPPGHRTPGWVTAWWRRESHLFPPPGDAPAGSGSAPGPRPGLRILWAGQRYMRRQTPIQPGVRRNPPSVLDLTGGGGDSLDPKEMGGRTEDGMKVPKFPVLPQSVLRCPGACGPQRVTVSPAPRRQSSNGSMTVWRA